MSPTIRRAWASFKAEQRKMAIAAVLVVVAVVLWVHLYWHATPVPAQAQTLSPPPSASAQGSARLSDRPVVRVNLTQDLGRDLFAFADSHYATQKPGAQLAGAAKSPASTVDNSQQAQIVTEAARSLKLQTTIVGAHPRAVINGQLVGPGDKIAGFTVRRILDRKVIVEMDGVQVRLEM